MMWFKRNPPPKPEAWVSPFYVSWHCNGCGSATRYEVKSQPRCCPACGCETFTERIGRERRSEYDGPGRFFPRGVEVPLD